MEHSALGKTPTWRSKRRAHEKAKIVRRVTPERATCSRFQGRSMDQKFRWKRLAFGSLRIDLQIFEWGACTERSPENRVPVADAMRSKLQRTAGLLLLAVATRTSGDKRTNSIPNQQPRQ